MTKYGIEYLHILIENRLRDIEKEENNKDIIR